MAQSLGEKTLEKSMTLFSSTLFPKFSSDYMTTVSESGEELIIVPCSLERGGTVA